MTSNIGKGARLRAVDPGVLPSFRGMSAPPLKVGSVYECELVSPHNELPCSVHGGRECHTIVTLKGVEHPRCIINGRSHALAYCSRSFRPADEDPPWMAELRSMADRAKKLNSTTIPTSIISSGTSK